MPWLRVASRSSAGGMSSDGATPGISRAMAANLTPFARAHARIDTARRRHRRGVGGLVMRRRILVLAIAGAAAMPGSALAGTTTVDRTIQDCDGDNLLEWAPGEAYLDLGAPPPPGSENACDASGGSR